MAVEAVVRKERSYWGRPLKGTCYIGQGMAPYFAKATKGWSAFAKPTPPKASPYAEATEDKTKAGSYGGQVLLRQAYYAKAT